MKKTKWMEQVPPTPDDLTDLAMDKWQDVCQWLIDGRGLREQDLWLVESAAVAYGNFREAMQGVEKNGMAVEGIDKEGNLTIKPNAYATEARYWQDVMARRLTDLGLAKDKVTREVPSEGLPLDDAENNDPSVEKKTGLDQLKIVG